MRNTTWLRYGLASIVVAGVGLGATLFACGDDDNATTTDGGPGTDTGPGIDSGPGTDSGPTDGGVDAGPPAKLILVNAVTDLGPNAQIALPTMAGGCTSTACDSLTALRVCFAVGASENSLSVTPLPALPDDPTSSTETPFGPGTPPGIYAGTGGVFPDLGVNLGGVVLRPYLMNAASLFAKGIVKPGAGNPGDGCDSLISAKAEDGGGPDGGTFQENIDYWTLPVIPAGTLKGPSTYVIALTGCANDADPSLAGKCGPATGGGTFTPAGTGSPGVGNLAARIYPVDSTTAVATTAIGTQFIHSSPQADDFFQTAVPGFVVPVQPGYITSQLTGTGYQPVTAYFADGGADGGVALEADASTLKPITGVTYASDSFTPTPGAAFADLAIKLTDINTATFGPDAGLVYASGGAFTFIMIGDPAQTPQTMGATGIPNPRLFHFLGYPNNPPVVTYKP